MRALDRCWGAPYSGDSGIDTLRNLAIQIVIHVGDSCQSTERDPNRHPGRPVILERTAGPPLPADSWPGSLSSQDLLKLPRWQAAVWIPPVYSSRIRSLPSAEFVRCSRLEVAGPACMQRMGKRRRRRYAPPGCCNEILRCQSVVASYLRSMCNVCGGVHLSLLLV
jgi:hypothetical protein